MGIFERRAEMTSWQQQDEKREEDLYKSRRLPPKKNDLWLLLKAMKGGGQKKKENYKFGSGRGGKNIFDVLGKKQLVIFKSTYNYNRNTHEKYLKEYMPQLSKIEEGIVEESPVFFGTDEKLYNEKMTGMHRKCIISPENQNIDLELLTKKFIENVQVLTGYKLLWRACVHNDTNHRHVHLCINGKDENEKKVYFQKEMVRRIMRETLQSIATSMAGERTQEEIQSVRQNLVNSKGWNNLDEKIKPYGKEISVNELSPELSKRVEFLSSISLAQKNGSSWILKDDWEEVLKTSKKYDSYLAEYLASDGKIEMFDGNEIKNAKIEKVITFDKDESWNDAVVVKAGDRLVYVPVNQLNKVEIQGKEVDISGGKKPMQKIRDSDIIVKDVEPEKRTRKSHHQRNNGNKR